MNLAEMEAAWSLALSSGHHRFLGELALDRGLFESLCEELGARVVNRGEFVAKDSLALTVLAVNCAYFDYDEDGFWTHFFKRLKVAQAAPLQDYIGGRFESTLDSYKIPRRRRTGTFRYVGCLLEQCGVTRKSLKHFAKFLGGLFDKHGVEGLQVLSLSKFQEHVPGYGLPAYLSTFLCDPSGWQFSRDVARNISQYNRGILSLEELKKIAGYHPSFWEELLNYRPPTPPSPLGGPSIPLPRLVLDRTYRQLVVLFEREFIQKGRYRMNGEVVREPALGVGTKLPFRGDYEVEISLGAEKVTTATIDGWDPGNGETPRAMFSLDGSFLQRVKTGRYIALVPFGCSKTPPHVVESSLETFNFRDFGHYQALHVNIQSDEDLAWANCNQVGAETEEADLGLISFDDDGTRLDGACDYFDVFIGALPPVKISSPSRFTSGELVLLVDFGAGTKKIPIGENQVVVDLNPLLTPPAKGTLWVEQVHRASRRAPWKRHSFSLLPKGTAIRWPTYVYSNAERPGILVDLPLGNITFEQAAWSQHENAWRVNEATTLVEGTLELPGFSVHLAKQVRRGSLLALGERGDNLLLADELGTGVSLRATGLPRYPVVVTAHASNHGEFSLGELGIFNGAGIYDFKSTSIRDAYKQVDECAVEVGLRFDNKLVLTGTWIVDASKFIDALDRCLQFETTEHAPTGFLEKDLVALISGILKKGVAVDSMHLSELPTFLHGWVAGCMLCAAVLDGVEADPVTLQEMRSLAGRVAAALDWYKAALQGNAGRGKPDWEPLLPRWKEKFDYYVALVDEEDVFFEWAEDVKTGPEYTSRISKLPNGRDLCDAWWRYWAHHSITHVYTAADRCKYSSHRTVVSLAEILKELCRAKRDSHHVHRAVISIPVDCLPLHEDDAALFQ